MQKQLKQIQYFNEAFGVVVNNAPTHLDSDTTALGIRLMREEVDEYETAAADHDMVEIADGLGDQLYILLGNIIKHGLQHVILEIVSEIHLSNMSKLEDGKVIYREDGKVMKGKYYFKPNIKGILDKAIKEKTLEIVNGLASGYVVMVGDKYVVPSDSNSGWALSDYPAESVPTEWLAMGLIDDAAVEHDIDTIDYYSTDELRNGLLTKSK
jgi:hypothetical protein